MTGSDQVVDRSGAEAATGVLAADDSSGLVVDIPSANSKVKNGPEAELKPPPKRPPTLRPLGQLPQFKEALRGTGWPFAPKSGR